MPNAIYVDLEDLSVLQIDIMHFVQEWVKTNKTPVSQKDIVHNMEEKGIKNYTVANALGFLVKRGYIRRAYVVSNKTFYVLIKKI